MHILIIRPGAIGDTLLTLPVIQALREQYASPHITLVGNAAVLPLAHATGIVDETHDYQEARWSQLFLPERIQHTKDVQLDTIIKRTQLAICWLRDPDSIVEQNLRTAGIERVIVAPGRPDPSTSRAVHITAYLAATIALSLPGSLHDLVLPSVGARACPRPASPLTASAHDLVLPSVGARACPCPASPLTASALGDRRTHIPTLERPVVLHPGSGGKHKCWPIEHFAEVIYYLWQQQRMVLVLAGPADQERLALLKSLLHVHPQPGQCEYLVDTPLLTIAQRLQQCQCYIGNDSGLTHLAAMSGLPTLALFGPSDPTIWYPPGPSVTILHAPALEQLDTATVIAKLAPLL